MENIGNNIQKICYWLAGILLVIGLIVALVVAKDVVGSRFRADEFGEASVAFWTTYAIYLGSGFGVFCFGTLFGYLNKICDFGGHDYGK